MTVDIVLTSEGRVLERITKPIDKLPQEAFKSAEKIADRYHAKAKDRPFEVILRWSNNHHYWLRFDADHLLIEQKETNT